MSRDSLWYGRVRVVAVGDRALLCDHEGDEQWLPKSLIDETSEIVVDRALVGDEGELALAGWKARDLGWE
jgi:hypothetical protein